jgi:hypothetical protein
MKDLFNDPYHLELHEILEKKGFLRKRMNKRIVVSYDTYNRNDDNITVVYYEDDTITILNEDGEEVSEELFNEITNGIFAESRH